MQEEGWVFDYTGSLQFLSPIAESKPRESLEDKLKEATLMKHACNYKAEQVCKASGHPNFEQMIIFFPSISLSTRSPMPGNERSLFAIIAPRLYIPHPKLKEFVLRPFAPAVVHQGKWLAEGIHYLMKYICIHSILLGVLSRKVDPYYMLIRAFRLPNHLIIILMQ